MNYVWMTNTKASHIETDNGETGVINAGYAETVFSTDEMSGSPRNNSQLGRKTL